MYLKVFLYLNGNFHLKKSTPVYLYPFRKRVGNSQKHIRMWPDSPEEVIAQCGVSQSPALLYQPPNQVFAGQFPTQPVLPFPPKLLLWKQGPERNLMYARASTCYGIE